MASGGSTCAPRTSGTYTISRSRLEIHAPSSRRRRICMRARAAVIKMHGTSVSDAASSFQQEMSKDKFSDQILALIRLAGEWAALALFLELYAYAAPRCKHRTVGRKMCACRQGRFASRESKDRSEQIFYNPADPFGFKATRLARGVYANY